MNSNTKEKMEKEFNLSEKIVGHGTYFVYEEKDIKEFIKRLKEGVIKQSVERLQFNYTYFKEFVDKLAGNKLK